MNWLAQKLGDIATQYPGAARILHAHRLDFCCAGQQTLADAIAAGSLQSENIVQQLDALSLSAEEVINWHERPVSELIQYIMSQYHEKHRQQLPVLITLANKVERVHARAVSCPTGLGQHLRDMKHELESHMMKEEQILFPMLAGGVYPSGPIEVMQAEHTDHGEALAELERLTHNLELPAGACATWTALYSGLRELKEDLMAHIALENHVLFVPRPEPEVNAQCCGGCQ
ncbi:MAG: iron-sulfur cluster repair protein YtfE [Bacterioplanes sp.]|nr:iron-sulfur cluster repair protein YtfE [Bacterioplanes sp.]